MEMINPDFHFVATIWLFLIVLEVTQVRVIVALCVSAIK